MSANLKTTKERTGSLNISDFLFVLLLFLFSLPSSAQDRKNEERVVIGDSRFILHTVQKKETLYSISKLYGCTQEEVLSSNKNIAGVIKKGMVLKIPDHAYQKPQPEKFDTNKFLQHLVVSGDNYYQLKLKYGIEEEELIKYNPDLTDGLKTGRTILVPRKSKTETAEKEPLVNDVPPKTPTSPIKAPPAAARVQGSGKTFKVGLYLPISAVVTDSLKPTARTLSFLAYYQGALMAVDQLSKAGLNTKLFVYDTEKLTSKVELLVKKPEFLSMDLLIGPVYPENQKLISELSAKNRIPMVSPMSSDDQYTRTNPCYFQVNPVRRLRMEATAEYLFREFPREKIIFLENENSSSETRLIHEQLGKKRLTHGASAGLLQTCNLWVKGTEGLEALLQVEKPNILVMADMNEVNISIAMNRLALLSKKYTLILIGVQEYTRMQSIELENLHNVNLRVLTSSFVDYSRPDVLNFVENFKTEFGTEPSLFAFQGYDATTWFLKSLEKSGDLFHGFSPDSNKGLLHTAYHFTRVSDFAGYTNDSFTIVEYASTFEVKSLGVVRHGE
jgi:LysM repeat protein